MAKKAYMIKSLITKKEYGPYVTEGIPDPKKSDIEDKNTDAAKALAGMLLFRKNHAIALGETKCEQLGNEIVFSGGEWAIWSANDKIDGRGNHSVSIDDLYECGTSVTLTKNKIAYLDNSLRFKFLRWLFVF